MPQGEGQVLVVSNLQCVTNHHWASCADNRAIFLNLCASAAAWRDQGAFAFHPRARTRDEKTGIAATRPSCVRALARLPTTAESLDARDDARASAKPFIDVVAVVPRPNATLRSCGGVWRV